jgi:hypothetical protein
MRYISHLIIFCAGVYGFPLYSQSTLPVERVKVVKDFDVKLLATESIPLPALYPEIPKKQENLSFHLSEYPMPLEYPAPSIKPIAAITQAPKEAYRGYCKGGMGLPTSFLVDGSLWYRTQEKTEWNTWFNHTSLDNSKAIEAQKSALNQVGLGVEKEFNNQVILNTSLQIDHNTFHWFAPWDSLPTGEAEDLSNPFTQLQAEAKLKLPSQNISGMQYEFFTQLYTLSNNFATRENGIVLKGLATYEPSSQSILDISLQMDASSLRDTQTQQLNNFLLGTQYHWIFQKGRIKLGGNLAKERMNYYLLPAVEAQLNLRSHLQASLGAEGLMHKNHFQYFSSLNPFIAPIFGSINNDVVYHLYARAQFQYQSLTLQAVAGWENHSNLPYFISDADNIRAFTVLYDQVKNVYGLLTVGGEPTKGMKTHLRIQQNFFSPNTVERLFGQPTFELNWTNQYAIFDQQLLVTLNFDILGGLYHQSKEQEAIKSNTLFDFSLGANYFFSKNWGVFVEGNNLLNNKFRRWYQTPTFGTTLMAGIVFRWK